MAIRNTNRKPFIVDNDTNRFVGIDLPVRKGHDRQGYFASTSTTIEATKNNIRNLLSTHRGERIMQPNLGLNLRDYLFEQINDELLGEIQTSIIDTFNYWLPFVSVENIRIDTIADDNGLGPNTLKISVDFVLKKDPGTLDSVQVTFSNNARVEATPDTTTTDTTNNAFDNAGGGGAF